MSRGTRDSVSASILAFSGLYSVLNRSLPVPQPSDEFSCAHDVCKWVVISVNGEVWCVEIIVPKIFTHCPLRSQKHPTSHCAGGSFAQQTDRSGSLWVLLA